MQVRLQVCQNWEPKEVSPDASQLDSDTLQKWLKRLQFKLGQIEVQSSAATQFYTIWNETVHETVQFETSDID